KRDRAEDGPRRFPGFLPRPSTDHGPRQRPGVDRGTPVRFLGTLGEAVAAVRVAVALDLPAAPRRRPEPRELPEPRLPGALCGGRRGMGALALERTRALGPPGPTGSGVRRDGTAAC